MTGSSEQDSLTLRKTDSKCPRLILNSCVASKDLISVSLNQLIDSITTDNWSLAFKISCVESKASCWLLVQSQQYETLSQKKKNPCLSRSCVLNLVGLRELRETSIIYIPSLIPADLIQILRCVGASCRLQRP